MLRQRGKGMEGCYGIAIAAIVVALSGLTAGCACDSNDSNNVSVRASPDSGHAGASSSNHGAGGVGHSGGGPSVADGAAPAGATGSGGNSVAASGGASGSGGNIAAASGGTSGSGGGSTGGAGAASGGAAGTRCILGTTKVGDCILAP